MHPVSPYPNTVLAAWQLALIAVVAISGIAVWLGAVYLRRPGATDPRPGSGLGLPRAAPGHHTRASAAEPGPARRRLARAPRGSVAR